jgi:hypothetical protein
MRRECGPEVCSIQKAHEIHNAAPAPKTARRQQPGVRGRLSVRLNREKNEICAGRLVGLLMCKSAGAWAGSEMGSGFPIWKKPAPSLGDDHAGPRQTKTTR